MASRFLKALPWGLLLPAAFFLGLAPFFPEPHLLEKLRMLGSGQLNRPLDLFDFVLHGTPLLLLLGKALMAASARFASGSQMKR